MDNDTPKNNTYITLAWSVVFVVAIIAFLVWDSVKGPDMPGTSISQDKEITFIIDYGGGQRRFRGQFGDDVRVWDLLQQATAFGGIALETERGFIPTKIDGHIDGDGGEWKLYINGFEKNTLPFETMVKAGDKVEYRFLSFSN